jgi:hypothetical protein
MVAYSLVFAQKKQSAVGKFAVFYDMQFAVERFFVQFVVVQTLHHSLQIIAKFAVRLCIK